MTDRMRPTRAEIDVAAVAHNVGVLRDMVAPAALCVVVKADGYGHGAVDIAHAALAAGAESVAVALVEEGVELREAGVVAPVLVLSEPTVAGHQVAVEQNLEPTVDTPEGVRGLADMVGAAGRDPLTVHLKVDTGMHRVGCRPDHLVDLANAVIARPELLLGSVWTHCAVADQPLDPFTVEQLARYDAAIAALADAGIHEPRRHAANSATAMTRPEGRFDLVRCGITAYGIAPSDELADQLDLRPVMRLVSGVSHLQRVSAGEAISYGQRYRLERDSIIATVPIGYADGVPRALGAKGGEVLIGGRRRPIAGTVTMDQIMVDLGDDDTVSVEQEVVLIGTQGDQEITAWDWAHRLDTIAYEIVCGIGARVPREVV